MARQLAFDLPSVTALGRDDFFVSPANAAAVASVDSWPTTRWRTLFLIGPKGAGKTHLAHVWSALSGAAHIQAIALRRADIPALAAHCLVVEDVQQIAGDDAAETALFHLYNLAKAEGGTLLLTAECEPQTMGLTLPDLESRLHQLGGVQLRAPDDALLAAVLMKLFADRQLNPRPDVIPYLTRAMERSFEAARTIVEALDTLALSEGRDVSRKLASEVMERQAELF
ncbi:DnaA/Hda family protein [uncultured Lentibacter sp.]|uniref:DnaA ATPase domain-containing protein n=1 Tax=uncultured Lentibacter sp. TaxID=1659309 RepID=UPI00261166ED|nr:DnaA/Hda family protein [uncultured Lentibacter sp.]